MHQVKSYVLLLFCGLKDLALGKPLRLCLVISEFLFCCRQAKSTALFLPFVCTTMKEDFQLNMWYLLMSHLAMLCILGMVIRSFHLLNNAEGGTLISFPRLPLKKWLLFCIASGYICYHLLSAVTCGLSWYYCWIIRSLWVLKYLVTWILLWK